jgi:hypothetical protein
MTTENGFDAKASYSAAYNNARFDANASPPTTKTNYKDLQVFYGAKAEVGRELQWDMSEADPTQHISMASTAVKATLTGYRIPANQNNIALNGKLQLNGVALMGDVTASMVNLCKPVTLHTGLTAPVRMLA